ncbi:MAG: hypothetical protein ACYTHJ_09980 [Planctomycetota bacterium]|jgi:hypothetical protein
MQVRFHCPTDKCVAIIEYEPLEECGSTILCPRCGIAHPVKLTETTAGGEIVDQCVICGGTELFIRKDFPQKLGLFVVVVFGLASLYFFTRNVLIAWGVLAFAVLIDVVIYMIVGKVTACYSCRAEYRKCALNPAHEQFDLATSEKY